jgi:hypothetical protein
MLKYYVKTCEAVNRLRTDKGGVVSLEYVIVAACVCAVVFFVFNGNGANSLNNLLTTAFGKIGTQIANLP